MVMLSTIVFTTIKLTYIFLKWKHIGTWYCVHVC